MAFVAGGGALAPWLLDALSFWAAGLVSAIAGAALSAGFLLAGWFGARQIVRLSWSADGRWLCTLRNGRSLELVLDLESRVTPHLLWLRWRPEGAIFRRRAMLLSRLDLPPGDLRRLVARLRLEAPPATRERTAPQVVVA